VERQQRTDRPGNDWKFRGFASPNYTMVPDELFDELMPDLSGAELKVLLYIVRRTFGFKKGSDRISKAQLENGIRTKDGRILDRGTGLSRRAIRLAVDSLVEKNILLKFRHESPDRGYEATEYALNVVGVGPTPGVKSTQGLGYKVPKPLGREVPIQYTVIQETDEQNNVVVESETQEKNDHLKTAQEVTRKSDTSENHNSLREDRETAHENVVSRAQHEELNCEQCEQEEVASLLVERGMTVAVARRLARVYGREYVCDKIKMVDDLVEQGSSLASVNPAGYLRCAIEEDYRHPRKRNGGLRQRARQFVAEMQGEQAEAQPVRAEVRRQAKRGDTEDGKVAEVWQQAKRELELALSPGAYMQYVYSTRLLSLTGGIATLGVSNRFVGEWLEKRLAPVVCHVLEGIVGQPVTLRAEVVAW